jgi:hypothetical protein
LASWHNADDVDTKILQPSVVGESPVETLSLSFTELFRHPRGIAFTHFAWLEYLCSEAGHGNGLDCEDMRQNGTKRPAMRQRTKAPTLRKAPRALAA